MNQEKIGKFIATTRRQNKLTQGQLAEKLGVSTNAVSKWERGLCLMDMSLLKPLSEILGISINEILSGELIKEEDLKNKTEENIISITELYDLKSIKSGAFTFTVITLLLLIYCGKKGMNTLPIIIIWFAYNLSYTHHKYKLTRNKKDIMISLLYGLGFIIAMILFFIKTF